MSASGNGAIGSTMSLYNRAGGESNPADTGLSFGRQLYDSELAARTRYAEPHVPPQGETQYKGGGISGADNSGIPDWYNKYPAPPVKYTTPSAAKERMAARQAIRQAATENKENRPDPISSEEVDYLQAMQDQTELADFDQFVNKLIDPKRPGMMKVLMDIYPEFVNRRIKQAHTDYEFAMRKQMIDTWGVQTFDDLHFLYLCDQNKIDGPSLQFKYSSGQDYNAGVLAPDFWKSKKLDGVRAPYASSRYGPSAPNANSWIMDPTGQAFSTNRGLNDMAKSMYRPLDSYNNGKEGSLPSGSAKSNMYT